MLSVVCFMQHKTRIPTTPCVVQSMQVLTKLSTTLIIVWCNLQWKAQRLRTGSCTFRSVADESLNRVAKGYVGKHDGAL